jgi:hypothetical protein
MGAVLRRAMVTCQQLFGSARSGQFLGHDPYDALNSTLFQQSPLARSRVCRLAWTQLNKKMPVSWRQVVGVPRHMNPKGLALFLSGLADLQRTDLPGTGRAECLELARLLESKIRPGYSGACWGYPFPWQSRAFYLPSNTPTIVATVYAANALMDAYDELDESRFLGLARSACDFILLDLKRVETLEGICFSYSPIDETIVHNASIMGARLLSRVGGVTGENELKDTALEAARFTVHHQRPDGAWPYGSAGYHQWTDHFHTGFVLDCLRDCARVSGGDSLDESIERGFLFYQENLFLPDGTPKYYSNRAFPLDVHCYAQAIMTLLDGGNRSLAVKVAENAIRDLWHPSGYFCYQKTRWYRNQVRYLRWSQAWMFRGLAALIKQC